MRGWRLVVGTVAAVALTVAAPLVAGPFWAALATSSTPRVVQPAYLVRADGTLVALDGRGGPPLPSSAPSSAAASTSAPDGTESPLAQPDPPGSSESTPTSEAPETVRPTRVRPVVPEHDDPPGADDGSRSGEDPEDPQEPEEPEGDGEDHRGGGTSGSRQAEDGR